MNKAQGVASELEASLRELLGVLGEGGATADVAGQLQTRCHDLTNALVEATTTCTATELGEAKPALQRAQRLNAIARGVVEGSANQAHSRHRRPSQRRSVLRRAGIALPTVEVSSSSTL